MHGLKIEVGSEVWWEAIRENLKDIHRECPQEGDSKDVEAARKYLGARYKRLSIESEFGGDDKLMAFPYRIAERGRARRLSRILGVEYESVPDRDALLPTLARMTIDNVDK